MNLNQLKPKNPILFILILVFLFVNIVDIITAFFILPGEANPIFLLVGSIWPVLIVKIIIVFTLAFYCIRNIYSNNFVYYMIVLILSLGIVIVGLASYSNIQGIMNPMIVEAAADIPDEIKAKAYWNFVTWLYYIPLAFCLFTFILYDKSYKYIEINPQYFKRKKWWKRW